MASKLSHENQKITTPSTGRSRVPDKQDPLDLETLNSELKGKERSKQMRLRDRQEREKLLQQHRMHQKESLKRQHERENLHRAHLTGEEHRELNQHSENEKPRKGPSAENFVFPDILHEDHQRTEYRGIEAHHDPVIKSSVVHEKGSNKVEIHGALGDTISKNIFESDLQRCRNCCGRPQLVESQEKREYESEKGLVQASDKYWEDKYNHEYVNDINEGEKNCCKCKKDKINEFQNFGLDSCGFHVTGHLELSKSGPSSFQKEFFNDEDEMRLRGGCGGGCGGGGGTRNSACCPCGGCGGAACDTNRNCEVTTPARCCGGNQPRGLPCRCKCRSCSNPCPPCGTCGGQNCGKWNSCAGSGGGKCCFPRNTKRRNGPGCCGGGSGSCGGCC